MNKTVVIFFTLHIKWYLLRLLGKEETLGGTKRRAETSFGNLQYNKKFKQGIPLSLTAFFFIQAIWEFPLPFKGRQHPRRHETLVHFPHPDLMLKHDHISSVFATLSLYSSSIQSQKTGVATSTPQ